MSGPIEEKDFEDYLQRKSTVSHHYHSIEHAQPPADLDAKIVAKAAAELRSPLAQKSRTWKKWSLPVALAASSVIAVSIVLESGMQHEATTSSEPVSVRSERQGAQPVASESDEGQAFMAQEAAQPANASKADQDQETLADVDLARPHDAPALEAQEPVRDEMKSLAKRAEQKAEESERAPPVVDSAAEQRVAHPASENSAALVREPLPQYSTTSRRAAPPTSSMEVRDRAPAAAAPAAARSNEQQADLARDPEEWLERIRTLREKGEEERADAEWRQFELAFPDYVLAPDDLARPRELR